MTNLKNILILLLVSVPLQINLLAEDVKSLIPERVVLNLTVNPASGISVTWRTGRAVKDPQIQYSEAEPWTEFTTDISAVSAVSERVILDTKDTVYYHHATLNGLIANRLYVYRVGGGNTWCEWNQFRTASLDTGAFKFVYFGDAQHGLHNFLPRVLRMAYNKAPDSRFWIFTGDMVDRAEFDSQWNELFTALSFFPSNIPWMSAPGNHEYPDTVINGKEESNLHPSFKYHFTFPENGLSDMKELCYFFDFQGVRMIVLNGNENLKEQSKWLDSVLANNPNKWTVAAIHQPIYSMGKKRDQSKTRTAFLPVFDKYSVDLVLQGHDHVYSRSAKLRQGRRTEANEMGTVYVTSQCGTDGYPLNNLYEPLMEKTGIKNQWFQVVFVRKDELEFKAFTVDGNLFDSFKLNK